MRSLRLERLEDRVTPSSDVGLVWTGAISDNYAVGGNWSAYDNGTDVIGSASDAPPTLFDPLFFNYRAREDCSLKFGDVGLSRVIKVDPSFGKSLRVGGNLVVDGSTSDYSVIDHLILREYGNVQFGRGMTVLSTDVSNDGDALSGQVFVGYGGRIASLIKKLGNASTEWDVRLRIGGHFYETYANGNADVGTWDVNFLSPLIFAKGGYVDVNQQGTANFSTTGNLANMASIQVYSEICGITNYGALNFDVRDLDVDAVVRNYGNVNFVANSTMDFSNGDQFNDEAAFGSFAGTVTFGNGVKIDISHAAMFANGFMDFNDTIIETASGDGVVIMVLGDMHLDDCVLNARGLGGFFAYNWMMANSTFNAKIDTDNNGISFRLGASGRDPNSPGSIVCTDCKIIVMGIGNGTDLIPGNKWELLTARTSCSHPPVTVNVNVGENHWGVYWDDEMTDYGITILQDEQLPPPDVTPPPEELPPPDMNPPDVTPPPEELPPPDMNPPPGNNPPPNFDPNAPPPPPGGGGNNNNPPPPGGTGGGNNGGGIPNFDPNNLP